MDLQYLAFMLPALILAGLASLYTHLTFLYYLMRAGLPGGRRND